MTSGASSTSQDKTDIPMYTDRDYRISKDNLYMVLALYMEKFPLPEHEQKEIDPYRKVGAVLVLPNDMLHAADCSRNGVHGVARLLMKHYDVAKDCKIFVSRKPCSFCTKLLVQCKIKRVFYLPIEPEYKDLETFQGETSRVDMLFQTNAISQSVFVPSVGMGVIASAEKKRPTITKTRPEIKKDLFKTYWNEDWFKKVKNDLPWSAFDDNMKIQVEEDFTNIMEWMARNVLGDDERYTFKASHQNRNPDFDLAEENNLLERGQASHLITIAKFLAERSDDPKTGVGAVITNSAKEIVALGWNGFPTKALYGEFPRASHDDDVEEKKYPYTIHAEQNALIFRNTKNLADGILFVTKTPCDECTPLLEMERIKTVVLSCQLEKKASAGNRTYTTSKFPEKAKSGVFTCYEMSSGEPAAAAKRDLFPKN